MPEKVDQHRKGMGSLFDNQQSVRAADNDWHRGEAYQGNVPKAQWRSRSSRVRGYGFKNYLSL